MSAPPDTPPRPNLLRRTFRGLRRTSLRQATRAFRALPMEKCTILFESHRGLSCSCNPRAIYEEILRQGLAAKCVWSVRDMSLEVPDGVIRVRRSSPRYYYYLSCAQILVQNGEFS